MGASLWQKPRASTSVTSTGRYWTVRLTGHGLGVGSLRNQSPKLPPERPSSCPNGRTGAGWVLVEPEPGGCSSTRRWLPTRRGSAAPPSHLWRNTLLIILTKVLPTALFGVGSDVGRARQTAPRRDAASARPLQGRARIRRSSAEEPRCSQPTPNEKVATTARRRGTQCCIGWAACSWWSMV
jgi:hypothetical protein